jgi:hypothetical protein
MRKTCPSSKAISRTREAWWTVTPVGRAADGPVGAFMPGSVVRRAGPGRPRGAVPAPARVQGGPGVRALRQGSLMWLGAAPRPRPADRTRQALRRRADTGAGAGRPGGQQRQGVPGSGAGEAGQDEGVGAAGRAGAIARHREVVRLARAQRDVVQRRALARLRAGAQQRIGRGVVQADIQPVDAVQVLQADSPRRRKSSRGEQGR